jgi:hypothetical protein
MGGGGAHVTGLIAKGLIVGATLAAFGAAQAASPPQTGHGPAAAPQAQDEPQSHPDERALDLTYWGVVQHTSDPARIERYLERFPKGAFASLASKRLAELAQGSKETGANVPQAAPSQDATAPNQAAARQLECAYWVEIYYSGDPRLFRGYLHRYPNGLFVDIAKQRLAELPN